MLRGIGFPFAHDFREIAPSVFVPVGSNTGAATVGSSLVFSSQIGLGKTEVTFLVPQPTRNMELAKRKCLLEGALC